MSLEKDVLTEEFATIRESERKADIKRSRLVFWIIVILLGPLAIFVLVDLLTGFNYY